MKRLYIVGGIIYDTKMVLLVCGVSTLRKRIEKDICRGIRASDVIEIANQIAML